MKLKKLASLAMSGVLCVSMLAACGGGSSSSAAVSGSAASGSASAEGTGNVTPVGEYPIVNEPITFKIMGAKDPGAPDWSELEVFQRLSEITNINFEFEVSETGTWPEQKNIALVGGEYGDIILRDKSATDANMAVTDEETYGPQGIFLDLTDLIDQYAPNIKAMMEKYPPHTATESTMQRDVVQTYEGRMRRTRVRLTKQSLVDRAVENGVKPFTALAGLLSLALRSYLGKDEIQYSYSADTRREAGVPDALYNCVCSFQSGVKLNDDTRLADIVPEMDAEVLRTLQPEAKLRQMVQQMSWVYKVDQQKAPLRIKQRVFQMGEYISGVPADFWLSYLGNPLLPATPELQKYTKDFNVWVPPDGGSMGVEASSLNGIITLCIENKAEMPGLAGMIRTAFEKEDITVLEAVDLDT
mgnify:CR=1 FL=1